MDLPNDDTLRWLVSRYARLHAAHGEVLGTPRLVRPNGDSFPDEFSPSPKGVATFFKRMLSYAPVADDLAVSLAFLEPDEASGGGGGCGSGACGTKSGGDSVTGGVSETNDGYVVTLSVADVSNATLMATSLARSIGTLVLSEAGEDIDEDEVGAMSELAATMSGFGVLLAAGSYVYGKGCGGVHVRQATVLAPQEIAILLALFVRLHGEKPGAARADLGTTQREAFDDALRWVDSNPKLLAALKSQPETLVDGIFPVEETRGFFGRFFGRREATGPTENDIVLTPKRTRTEAELRKLAEAKALVEEALKAR